MTSELRTISVSKRRPDKSRRLLLLSTDMGMGGGAEEQVIDLAYGFQARGWKVMIVSMLPPSPMPPDFAGRGIPLEHLGMRRGMPGVKGMTRLSRLIREFRPDVVHSHMTHANLLARIVRLIEPFPVLVGTLHNLTMAGVERDHTKVFEAAHRLTDGLSERTTAICHAAAEYYVRQRAVPASKMLVVHNGIDINRFQSTPGIREQMRQELGVASDFVWLAVGRLEAQKAYPTLLRAFALLGQELGTLLICGQGSLRAELETLADELGIANRVRFLGLRGDIPNVMSAADGFVMSSDMEGLPLVLLQAAAAGLPIVATDVGGNSEVVVDGENGYLVPPGQPELLAKAMIRLAAANRATMGRVGLARARELFGADRILARWERLYGELLEGAGGVAARFARRNAPATVRRIADKQLVA
jgi:glycosyltransferase involved in cell wall biosynthesis